MNEDRARIEALPVLRLNGENLDMVTDADAFAIDLDEYDEFVRLDDVLATLDEARESAGAGLNDPYLSRAAHAEQEAAGTHLFDSHCPFCFFDSFDAEARFAITEDRALAAAHLLAAEGSEE